jgi:hypothetical protein
LTSAARGGSTASPGDAGVSEVLRFSCLQPTPVLVGGAGRTCASSTRAVGRPFLVAGEARLAPTAARSDWRSTPASPDLRSISLETRGRLAEAWTQTGRMEHASIAAFARFALQLLAVGAAPDLVLETQRAMADETKHAQLAFGLAGAYAGADVGPAPLAIDDSLPATDLRGLLATVFAEGCVGETVAALEAREALAHVRDPAVRAVLETIAEDEQRHAALAWRTIAWVLEVAGPKALRWIDEAASDAVSHAGADVDAPPADADDLLILGVVDDARRQRLRRAALDQVVLPCAGSARTLVTAAA